MGCGGDFLNYFFIKKRDISFPTPHPSHPPTHRLRIKIKKQFRVICSLFCQLDDFSNFARFFQMYAQKKKNEKTKKVDHLKLDVAKFRRNCSDFCKYKHRKKRNNENRKRVDNLELTIGRIV